MPDFLAVCEQAARAGGQKLLDWQGRFSVREKGVADLVTDADLASQEAVREVIWRTFPNHAFIGEEGGSRAELPKASYRWIVDPLDGTTNFVHGVPHFAVSVALEHEAGLLAGTVYDPVLNECYTAAKGEGAKLNGKPLKVSMVKQLRDALVASSFPAQVAANSPLLTAFAELIQVCQALRRGGSAALNLAYIAAGRFDAYWAADLQPWDAAAGALLVQEAGGVLAALDGEEFRVWEPRLIATATPELFGELQGKLRQIPGLV
jgi:myo-inositol-1(or 4)-monophosphatase